MRSIISCAGLVLLAGAVAPAAAQGGLAGTWATQFDIGVRNENGVETSMGKRDAHLVITTKGDSVFGVWQVLAAPGSPAPAPVHLKGTGAQGAVTLVAEPVERTVQINDAESKVKMVSTYQFTRKDDQLTGTVQIAAIDTDLPGMTRAFLATRVKP